MHGPLNVKRPFPSFGQDILVSFRRKFTEIHVLFFSAYTHSKTAVQIFMKFENMWLCQTPTYRYTCNRNTSRR